MSGLAIPDTTSTPVSDPTCWDNTVRVADNCWDGFTDCLSNVIEWARDFFSMIGAWFVHAAGKVANFFIDYRDHIIAAAATGTASAIIAALVGVYCCRPSSKSEIAIRKEKIAEAMTMALAKVTAADDSDDKRTFLSEDTQATLVKMLNEASKTLSSKNFDQLISWVKLAEVPILLGQIKSFQERAEAAKPEEKDASSVESSRNKERSSSADGRESSSVFATFDSFPLLDGSRTTLLNGVVSDRLERKQEKVLPMSSSSSSMSSSSASTLSSASESSSTEE